MNIYSNINMKPLIARLKEEKCIDTTKEEKRKVLLHDYIKEKLRIASPENINYSISCIIESAFSCQCTDLGILNCFFRN